MEQGFDGQKQNLVDDDDGDGDVVGVGVGNETKRKCIQLSKKRAGERVREEGSLQ
jgi:hypothetical protein